MKKKFIFPVVFLLLLSAGNICPVKSTAKSPPRNLYPILHSYARELYTQYDEIEPARKAELTALALQLKSMQERNLPIRMVFYDYNQNVLSQMAQALTRAAAWYYHVDQIQVFSAGVEPLEIPIETIHALENIGFIVYKSEIDNHNVYQIKYSYNLPPVLLFAKKHDYRDLPGNQFIPILLEEQAKSIFAERGLPSVAKIIPYTNPGGYAGMENAKQTFDATIKNMATEIFYIFWHLKKTP
ncbi:MAG: hypothetical protein JJU28_14000 [Cyclobacteriaceae bacterium]|nr:hypothetical protein [Cyclobacteriaceae bacterium]